MRLVTSLTSGLPQKVVGVVVKGEDSGPESQFFHTVTQSYPVMALQICPT